MRFQDLVINNKYRLVRRLEDGSFEAVYLGTWKKVMGDLAGLTKAQPRF
jgi:hypothetical protein